MRLFFILLEKQLEEFNYFYWEVTELMKKIFFKDTIPIIVSIILVIYSIGITIFTDYVLNYKHYIGFSLIAISSIFFIKNKTIYFYIFGLTLLAGTVNIIDIFYATVNFGIGFISFNPIFLALLLLFFVFNKKMIDEMFPEKNNK